MDPLKELRRDLAVLRWMSAALLALTVVLFILVFLRY
jgi:hypothetical protein